MRTNIKGDIGELLVMTKFLKEGYWVSKPFGDDTPYDIIIDDKNGNVKRVQVKYVTPRNNTLACRLFSNAGIPYKQSVDWIMVVNSETEEIYCVDTNEINEETTVYLRLTPPKNNQKTGVRLAENYLI